MTIEDARRYLAAGWSPIPIPARRKHPPPDGVTGWDGAYLSDDELARYDWTGNIALRLPPDVVGIDVDVYHGGGESMAELEAKYGELPPSWCSTSRDDGSGIALFRVPIGTTLRTNPATGVETIQCFDRYVMCAPSTHPPDGRLYRWLDELAEEVVDGPPHPGELPDLPWSWIEALTTVKGRGERAATPGEAIEFVANHTATDGGWPGALDAVLRRLAGTGPGGRHDELVSSACQLARESAAGYYAAGEAFERLRGVWEQVVDARRADSGEFDGAVGWAIGQANADPARIAELSARLAAWRSSPLNLPPGTTLDEYSGPEGCEGETAEKSAGALRWPTLSEELWNTRPVLAHIRQAARAQMASPAGVLAECITRTATLISPDFKLPAVIGDQATLDFIACIVADTSGGKGIATKVARRLIPEPDHDPDDDSAYRIMMDLPIGSGEGVAQAFIVPEMKANDKGKLVPTGRQVVGRQALHLSVDEGTAFVNQADRRGTTIVATLASAWSGAALGQLNASEETKRLIAGGRVRVTGVIEMQAENGHLLLTPQFVTVGLTGRILFATAHDGTAPPIDELPEWPGELTWPTLSVLDRGAQEFTYTAAIVHNIRTKRYGVLTGKAAIDRHRSQAILLQCKVAAVLAWWEGRVDVSDDDWRIAAAILATSDAVLAHVEDVKRRHDAVELERRAVARGIGEAVADTARERKLVAELSERIVARVPADGIGRNELARALTAKSTRHRFTPALELAVASLRLVVADGRISKVTP